MELSFKLESFEGPLDLLLHLIDKNKVDIYDIPIAMITDQYLEYMRAMKDRDADRMSEFLVMAATLLDIKAKMLLPKDPEEEVEEEDPRAELVRKLLEYKMYKYMSYELKDKEVSASHALYKEESIPEEVKRYEAPIDLDVLLADTTMQKLQEIFDDVIRRSVERTNLNALRMQSIRREQVSIVERVEFICDYLKREKECSFRKLIERQETKMNVIVTFLAVLELMKAGNLRAEMTDDGQDILISRREENDEAFDEEFEIPEDIKKREHRREVRAANKAAREAAEAARLAAESAQQEAEESVQQEAAESVQQEAAKDEQQEAWEESSQTGDMRGDE